MGSVHIAYQIDMQREVALKRILPDNLARILAVAHNVGVIHRDVKPANIILEAGGRARLIDFGICAFLPRFSGRPALRSVGENEYKTGPMEVAGSPGYTDPALFSGHHPSPQSDVFSV